KRFVAVAEVGVKGDRAANDHQPQGEMRYSEIILLVTQARGIGDGRTARLLRAFRSISALPGKSARIAKLWCGRVSPELLKQLGGACALIFVENPDRVASILL